MAATTKQPLLLYVHVPFCTSKCHFCDWVQEIPASALRLPAASTPRMRYVQALQRQIAHAGESYGDRYAPAIVYWGGGTASILTADETRAIMSSLRAAFDFSSVLETTIESSPETLTPEKLALFREIGFDRISIGAQSFDDARLRTLGRSHDARTAVEALAEAAKAGFDNINVDLISGLPDETIGEFETSVRVALRTPVNHVSLYPFRPAPGTAIRIRSSRGLGGEVDLQEQLEAYELGRTLLEERGLREYAVSHFGAPECRSDLAYFQLRMDWLGFGSGATSLIDGEFLTTQRGALERYNANPLDPDTRFPAASPVIATRSMYQSLSTHEGAVASYWRARTGVALDEILAQPEISGLIGELSRHARVIRDDQGVRLQPERAAESFIRLLFSTAPREARRARAAEELIGAY